MKRGIVLSMIKRDEMIVMRNERLYNKNPKLPVYMPKSKPERKHGLPPNTRNTLKNLNDIVVFLWLKNGSSFWYFISYSTNNHLVGYIWNGNFWEKREILLRFIVTYY